MTTPDKRTITTDALETLGTKIDEKQKRDAIHLAVEPVVAAEDLYPGQDVGPDGSTSNPVGIVDPFLKGPIFRGERFWLVLYPRQITSLRHVWSHPAFTDEPEVGVHSEEELRKIAKVEEALDGNWIRTFADCLFLLEEKTFGP